MIPGKFVFGLTGGLADAAGLPGLSIFHRMLMWNLQSIHMNASINQLTVWVVFF